MNKILIVPLMVSLSMTTFAQDNVKNGLDKNKVQSTNTVKVSLKPEIVGLWGMPIPNNKKCTEYYNFQSNNNLIVNSGAEWSTGFYEYQPNQDADDKQSMLMINIKYDNNQTDCSGNRIDQTDEVSQYLVKWRDAKSFELCSVEENSNCFAILRKISP